MTGLTAVTRIVMPLVQNHSGSLELTETLPQLPVSDYILPGVFLVVVMGLAPLLLIDFEWAIQYITAVNGFLIILFVLVPGVRKFYAEM